MEAWLPRLSLALLPLELLLLQLVLAGGNPGPAPRLEMVLLWALAVLLPQLRPPWLLPLALVRPVLSVPPPWLCALPVGVSFPSPTSGFKGSLC